MLRTICCTAAIALGGVGAPTAAHAQRVDDGPELFIAIPETFPDIDARAILVREPGRDVIMLRPDGAQPEDLAHAMTLRSWQLENVPEPGTGEMFPITGGAFPYGFDEERRARMAELIERVSERPLQTVGSFGPGRWLRYDREEGERRSPPGAVTATAAR